MKHALALLAFCGVTASEAIFAQTPEFVQDPWEVRLPNAAVSADAESQRALRQRPFWINSEPASSGWQVVMHEDRESPSRMWGGRTNQETISFRLRAYAHGLVV